MLLSNLKADIKKKKKKSLNTIIKQVPVCSNPYIYTNVVQEVYNQDCSPEVGVIEGLAAAATKHLKMMILDIFHFVKPLQIFATSWTFKF